MEKGDLVGIGQEDFCFIGILDLVVESQVSPAYNTAYVDIAGGGFVVCLQSELIKR